MQLSSVLRPLWNCIASPPSDARHREREIERVGPVQRWAGLQKDEIDFWDHVLSTTRLNPGKPLQSYIVELIGAPPRSRVEILDVGAGPLTFLGFRWPGREVRITALDANALEYDRLLEKYGIEPPCRTKLGYAEDLASVVPTSFFDLVHARNCIDHSKDPVKAIKEMVRAAKPGGYVFLNHIMNEGRRNRYSGPHQWNFFPRNERFYIDRPGLQPVDMATELRESAEVRVGPSPDGPQWFTVTIRRC
jgi:SAM-dependent methyltransferase